MKKYIPVFVLLLFASVILAKETIDRNLAQLMMTPDLLTLQPQGEFESYTLTISGPDGIVFREIFSGLHMASFEPVDINGDILPDGSYSYEMVATPIISSAQKEAMRDARLSGDYSAVKSFDMTHAMVKGGHFTIKNGYFIVSEPEPMLTGQLQASDGRDPGVGPGNPTTGNTTGSSTQTSRFDDPARDQVILDDLIVDGSLCVGFDCDNGESFGFDTIRLKENNLRIKADDSSTGTFPSTDWQITFNDSANGGANKFSIDDVSSSRTPFTLEANAPSHSLYVDDGGRVGFGTTIPVADLHVVSGNSPTLRLEQQGSAGFAPQTWDVAGNETNFFVRDATNGSTLPFRIRPGAPSSSLYIDVDGDVGFGTTSPGAKAHIKGDVIIEETASTGSSDPNLLVSGDKARVLIDDASSVVNEIPFTIRKASTVNFQMIDTSASGTNGNWSIGVNGNAWFLSKTGGTGKEMEIANDGTFTLKAAGTQTAQVTTSGDLCLAGTVTCASDRDKKENFEYMELSKNE